MDQVAQIREKIDIIPFISEFVPLKRGGRNFKANCPFHGEKTPSFMVSPERQMWYCFGCNKGGDIYTFLMEYEHIEFPEALRLLAKRAGIELTGYHADAGIGAKKEALYTLNGLAAEFYHYILTKHPAGKRALSYIEKRGVTPKVMETFKLGFAPNLPGPLSRFLMTKKHYEKETLYEAGLSTYRGNSVADFFRDRIMFPLFDHRDNVVGFSGRVLNDKNAFGPKYINTKETLVYHKGELFFGLNVTKDSIRKENQAILLEGEFDVMSCFQNGISNVVAVKGTALTERQVVLLSRYANKLTVCFDGDRAGQEAIKRSLPIIEKKELQTTVIVIPSGKDPDEALKTNPVAFKQAVKADKNVYDYLLDKATEEFDRNTSQGKKQIADALLPTVSSIENAIIKEHYLKKLSTILDTTYESLTREIKRLEKKEPPVPLIPKQQVEKKPREEILEEYLVSLIVQYEKPREALEKAIDTLSQSMTKERAYQKILYSLIGYFETVSEFNSQQFGTSLPEELVSAFDKCLLFPLPQFIDSSQHVKEIKKVAGQLKDLYLRTKLKDLSNAIKAKEAAGEETEVELLKEDFSKISAQLRSN